MARKTKPKKDRDLCRDERVKIEADPEDALRALLKPRSVPAKPSKRVGR
jgi:hypothetical protein